MDVLVRIKSWVPTRSYGTLRSESVAGRSFNDPRQLPRHVLVKGVVSYAQALNAVELKSGMRPDDATTEFIKPEKVDKVNADKVVDLN